MRFASKSVKINQYIFSENDMEIRTLGKTDLKVSRISMGTMTFGGQVSEADSIRMVDHCLEAGINFFDTANVYNAGKSESALGKALKGRRHQVVLATKVCFRVGPEPDDAGLKRAAIRKAIDQSLSRLETDYVDLYYLHQPDWSTAIDETLAAMDELVQEGKVRYPATSNYASWQVLQMLWYCEDHGLVPPTVAQQMYGLLTRDIDDEYLAFSKEFKIGLVAYSPLAGGLLSGKHRAEDLPSPGTRFDINKLHLDRYWHPAYFEAVQVLSDVASRANLSLQELAFRWLLTQNAVDSIIVGASRLDQLQENLKACRGPHLNEEVLNECDAVWAKLRGITPRYNR
jgi:1-deoxyxylulose-5-phosphate synthase